MDKQPSPTPKPKPEPRREIDPKKYEPIEVDLSEFEPNKFKHVCPRCGMRFN